MSRWTNRVEELRFAVAAHGQDFAAVAEALGTTANALEIALRRNPTLRAVWDNPDAPAPETVNAIRTGDVVESEPSERIISLEQLLAAAKVNLDEWEVKDFRVNKWENAAKDEAHPGKMIVTPLFQVRANLGRPGIERLTSQLREAVVADVKADAARRHAVRSTLLPAARIAGRHMLEVCLMDLHVGKLAWWQETGEDYDSHIAERSARTAVSELLLQASVYELEKILLPLGNDFFHYDNIGGSTTAGTPQDRDTRLHKMFRKGRGLASWMIHECAKVAPVEVVVVPGNHDEVLSWMLGEVLDAEFSKDERVTVDNSPKLRKYKDYGVNLVGYTHGKDEPHAKLPLIMAQEAPEMWARTKVREWHTGHFHHSKVRESMPVDSRNGVRVRILQSLSGTDAYHYRKGYIGEPHNAEAFVWSHDTGLRANLFVCPELTPQPAMPALTLRAA